MDNEKPPPYISNLPLHSSGVWKGMKFLEIDDRNKETVDLRKADR